ncbi:RNA polymerase sigma factor [Solihabitans fulvus]|uniref:RNA polymerase sigma factor n=1 Tax=Solihabitans fulvus TaxID=1892852 RepID=A0A5B2XDZ9_9PSEU|nr:RNA polymerase sigma factor [Solihabitans fulvus]KAA2261269.1 RNA polymerase sigma factor [Solihabitans fulvus]
MMYVHRTDRDEPKSSEVLGRFWNECATLRPHLVGFAKRHVATPCQAEDIVHDALLRAAEFDRLDLDRLHPFLVSVVKRLCVDDARRRSVVLRAANHPMLHPPAGVDPAERACDRDEAQRVAARLHSLSDYERSLVSLAANGFSYAEIANRLGTTSGATQSAMHRIRHKVRSWR